MHFAGCRAFVCWWLVVGCLVSLPVFGKPVDSEHSENSPASSKPPLSQRPKIGLVLSGGGARGLAHIGVLKWLEEHRIPVDYLTGTSMGGLVGGMYSMGMPPAEIQKFMNGINWSQTLSSGPTFDQLAYRRKEDRRDFQVELDLGLRKGVKLPMGLSSAHYIGLMIDRLTLPYSNLNSFDELPIPYRCLATDFIAAQPVTLKDGSLATAMRATMSIPGLFPPVERDGTVLVDGALLNNIPTNAMREMKPDVVIAVDVGTQLGDLQTIASLSGIVQQSLTVMTIDSDRRNLALADLIVAPDLGNLSLLDFSNIDKAVDIGYQAADAKALILNKFALNEAEWQAYLDQRHARKKETIPVPEDLQVAGVDQDAQRELRRELESHLGKPLETQSLENDLTRFTGEGRYESLDYGFLPSSEAHHKNILQIRVKEKTYAPPTLNFSVELDGNDISDFNFSVGGRLTFFDLGKFGSEWRNDVKIGFRSLLATEYLFPLNKHGFFVAPRLFYRRDKESIFGGESRLAEFQVNRLGIGGDLGYLTRNSELRFGYELNRLDASLTAGQPPTQSVDGKVDFVRLRWAYDGQDSARVPTRGTRFSTEGRYVFHSPGNTTGFPQFEVNLSTFKPISERSSLFLAGLFKTSFNKAAAPFQKFTLGGPFQLGAYNRDEFRGNHAFLAVLGYQKRVYDLPPLVGGKVFAVGWYDIGGAYDTFRSPLYRQQVSGGFIVDTKIGPFSLIGAVGESGRGKVYFTFGKSF